MVNPRLQAADHPDVFAAGDLAAVTQPPSGQPLPMLAPVAIQSGRHAGRTVARLISGEPLTDFRYRDKGVLAVLGRGDAAAELPLIPGAPGRYQLRIRGAAGVAALAGRPHRLPDRFRNRLQVLIDWGGTTSLPAAADQLAGDGIRARIVDLYSVKPIDTQTLLQAAAATGDRVVVAEDHYPAGGIGSAVLNAFNDAGHPVQLSHLAVRDLADSGTPAELMATAGISADQIAQAARDLLSG